MNFQPQGVCPKGVGRNDGASRDWKEITQGLLKPYSPLNTAAYNFSVFLFMIFKNILSGERKL